MSENSKSIVYLDRNENPYGPAPACFEALNNINPIELYEYSRDFSRGVTSRLTERLANDFGLKEKNVIVGFGGEDILKQVVHCYIHQGCKIMIPSHSWWYYKKLSGEVDGINIEYPIVEGLDTFYYDIEGMLKVYEEHRPGLVLISSPNNPTGNRLEMDQLKCVLEKMKDTFVVLDEAYSLFCNNGNSHLKELLTAYPNLIIIRTFSKYYGLAGIRMGFALMGENHAAFKMFSARYLGYNRVSELLGLAALDSTEYYDDMREKIAADMDMFFREFNNLQGFRAFKSYANFILVEIPPEIKDALKKYLTERNMIVKFMAEDNLFNHLRITIGTREQNRLLMDMIKSFLKMHKQ